MENKNNNSVQGKNTSEFIKWLLELFSRRNKKSRAQNIVADILCVENMTVQRWIRKENTPIFLARLRIGHIREIFKVLSEKMHDEEIVLWIDLPNDFLEGQKPIDLLTAMTWKETEMVREAANKEAVK